MVNGSRSHGLSKYSSFWGWGLLALQESLGSIWSILKEKADEGKKYSSEKTLCFDYAWELKKNFNGNVEVDFEKPFFSNEISNKIFFLDLFAEINPDQGGEKVGFEFKFPTKSSAGGNTDQTATRVDIINDIKRLTWLVRKKEIDLGCFLCSTDQLPYINRGDKKKEIEFATYQDVVYEKNKKFPFNTKLSTSEVCATNDIIFVWTNVEYVRNKYKLIDGATLAWLQPIFIYTPR